MPSNKGTLKIMQWNAQGITKNSSKSELQNFIDQHRIEVIFLSETLLKPNHRFYLNNFAIYRRDRPNPGGGVAICVNKNIRHELLPANETENIEHISILVNVNGKKLILTSAYNPRYTSSFSVDISKLTPIHEEFILFGDLNARNTAWNCRSNNSAGTTLNTIQHQRNFFIHHSSSPTHYPHCGTTPSTIDIMLSNSALQISPLNAHAYELSSDHAPVVCTITAAIETKEPTQMYNFKQADWIAYQIYINNEIDPNSMFTNSGDIDNGIEHMVRTIHAAKERSVPLVSKHLKYIRLSNETKTAIAERNSLKRQWQRCIHDDRKRQLKVLMNTANRTIAKLVDHERNTQWSQTLQKLETGSKKFWRLCKTIKNKDATAIGDLKINNSVADTDYMKANALADAFESSHTLTHDSVSTMERRVRRYIDQLNETTEFELPVNAQITHEELKQTIKKLRNAKAPGHDGVANIMIKKLPSRATTSLVKLFNACLSLGYFPNHFKIAKIKAIPKPGKDLRIPTNYRPISLLSCVGKLFERLIHSRLVAHIDVNNLWKREQFGFRQQHSTVQQLKRVTNFIQTNKSNRRTTSMVLLDIEKAFDTIWHDGLIYKLGKMHTPIYIVKIVQSFTTERSFMVIVNGARSNIKNVVAGAPQGSSLSPTLYAVYTSDYRCINRCKDAYFADDTALYSATKTTNKSIRNVQSGLQSIEKYMAKWKIQINANKTQFIIFPFNRSRRRVPTISLRFQNNIIEPATTVKYLGVTLDQKLNFGSHIENTRTKATRAMCALYPMIARTSRLNHRNKNIIYKTMIRPIITYASPIWCNATRTRLKRLQVVQNKCLKMINNLPWRYGTDELHRRFNYPKITELLEQNHDKFKERCESSTFEMINSLFEY